MRNTNVIEVVILAIIVLLVWMVVQSKVPVVVKPLEVRVLAEKVRL